jgi:hypothetical protein
LALFLAGCTAGAEPESFVGDYYLKGFDGARLPQFLYQYPCIIGPQDTVLGTVQAGRGELHVRPNQSFWLDVEYYNICQGQVTDSLGLREVGVYRIAGNEITFIWLFRDTSGVLGTGIVDPPALTLRLAEGWDGFPFQTMDFTR